MLKSLHGPPARDFKITAGSHEMLMAAKVIWQHYRYALDWEHQYINDQWCGDWNALITFCEHGNDGKDKLAIQRVNIDDHYFDDRGLYEIGDKENWYGTCFDHENHDTCGQCMTVITTPFSH